MPLHPARADQCRHNPGRTRPPPCQADWRQWSLSAFAGFGVVFPRQRIVRLVAVARRIRGDPAGAGGCAAAQIAQLFQQQDEALGGPRFAQVALERGRHLEVDAIFTRETLDLPGGNAGLKHLEGLLLREWRLLLLRWMHAEVQKSCANRCPVRTPLLRAQASEPARPPLSPERLKSARRRAHGIKSSISPRRAAGNG